MMQQRVDECVFLVSGRGMHHQPGRFVQNQQRFVLEKDVERNFLGLRFSRPDYRPVDFDLLAGARTVRGFDCVTVDADVALFDQSFECNSRNGGKFFTQKGVEPPGRKRFFNGETFNLQTHGEVSAGLFGTCSFFQVMRNMSATPVQMAVSATLNAGKPISSPPRCCR